MKLANGKYNLKLEVEGDLIQSAGRLAIEHYPNEFGGFLVGFYSDDLRSLKVTDFVLPTKYKTSPVSFVRSAEGTQEKFKKLYEQTPKKYYIGEWHSHPGGSTRYSQTDLQAIADIEKCETVKIHNPILLILSIEKDAVTDFDFYLYKNQKISKYEK